MVDLEPVGLVLAVLKIMVSTVFTQKTLVWKFVTSLVVEPILT
jgi:hypothetical protein